MHNMMLKPFVLLLPSQLADHRLQEVAHYDPKIQVLKARAIALLFRNIGVTALGNFVSVVPKLDTSHDLIK